MQLDVYANGEMVQSIKENVVKETRHEQYYLITLLPDLRSLRLMSVGGSTSSRACLQQLYMLSPSTRTALNGTLSYPQNNRKIIHNGRLYIQTQQGLFTPQGIKVN